MVSLVMAAALMAGCQAGTVSDLQSRCANLSAQCEALQNELGVMKARLAVAKEAAENAAQQAADYQGMAEKAKASDAELAALRARIAELEAMSGATNRIVLPEALDDKLEQFAKAYVGLVTYDPDTGMIKYNDTDLLFELGSDTVRPSAMDSLKKLAEIIASPEAAAFDIVIVGHTDTTRVARPESIQRFGDNWGLSAFRARSVMNALKNSGVNEGKMAIVGFGLFRPISTDKAKNRRVEIFFERANRFSPAAAGPAAPIAPTGGPTGVPLP
jgi:flagellar motor protein MotB